MSQTPPERLAALWDHTRCPHEVDISGCTRTHAPLWEVVRWIDRGSQGCRGFYGITHAHRSEGRWHYRLGFECAFTAMIVKLNWG